MKSWFVLLPILSLLTACQTLDSIKSQFSEGKNSPSDQQQEEAVVDTSEVNYRLGLRYTNGIGGEQDFDAAANAFLKAAKQGHPKAQLMLGLAYQTGLGVKTDPNKAIHWLTKAAEQNLASAQLEAGKMYLAGNEIPTEEAWGLHWLGQAAIKGNAEAQYLVGVSWSTGIGVPKDFFNGAFWIALAAKQQFKESEVLVPKLKSQLTEKDKQRLNRKLSVWKPLQQERTPTQSLIYFVQYGLSQQNINPGTIDGIIGPKTKLAISQYQTAVMKTAADGKISQRFIASLREKLRGQVTEL